MLNLCKQLLTVIFVIPCVLCFSSINALDDDLSFGLTSGIVNTLEFKFELTTTGNNDILHTPIVIDNSTNRTFKGSQSKTGESTLVHVQNIPPKVKTYTATFHIDSVTNSKNKKNNNNPSGIVVGYVTLTDPGNPKNNKQLVVQGSDLSPGQELSVKFSYSPGRR